MKSNQREEVNSGYHNVKLVKPGATPEDIYLKDGTILKGIYAPPLKTYGTETFTITLICEGESKYVVVNRDIDYFKILPEDKKK